MCMGLMGFIAFSIVCIQSHLDTRIRNNIMDQAATDGKLHGIDQLTQIADLDVVATRAAEIHNAPQVQFAAFFLKCEWSSALAVEIFFFLVVSTGATFC